jgi:Protein of unknown function (DUF664)
VRLLTCGGPLAPLESALESQPGATHSIAVAVPTPVVEYLQVARDVMLWKQDGLFEYACRRPLTPTATDLLGLVKHLAAVELGYFGLVFDRPYDGQVAWFRPDLPDDMGEPNMDMWATPDESREHIVDVYRRACAHSDGTVQALPLDATGTVPWCSAERRHPSLHLVLVHVIAESHRHAGHADIVRELIDGKVGLRKDASNLPGADQAWWDAYRDQVERGARAASQT